MLSSLRNDILIIFFSPHKVRAIPAICFSHHFPDFVHKTPNPALSVTRSDHIIFPTKTEQGRGREKKEKKEEKRGKKREKMCVCVCVSK